MSYDGNTNTNTKTLSKFLFFCIFLIISPLFRADDKLMKNECHSSEFPTSCLQCLQSDPTSVMADRLGIATIIIHCLDSQLHLLINNITSVRKGGGGGGEGESEAVKKSVKDCKKGLSGSCSRMVSGALEGLKNGAYDKASRSVRVALEYPLTCASKLHALKLQSESEITLLLFHHFTLYQQLSNAAMRIIDRLQ